MRNRLVVLLMVLGVFTAPATASAAAGSLPLPYTGDANQVITVVAANPTATTATLIAWKRTATGWVAQLGPLKAYVGSGGIGQASEGSTKTPAGVWALTEAFGHHPAAGRLPYRQVDTSDWWVSDVNSAHYNTPYRCAPGACPFNEAAGENLGKVGRAYDRAVVMNYNRSPVVKGAGSAFFLHVSTNQPTAGCVSLGRPQMDAVLNWLDPAARPVINIGLG
ncbi:L,D-transpeptidase family protein [Actinokineospora diospyrosa]|uniref:L,D-peptidoglycan transpeptidase YkuD, ErfK/YbiS/YcfS/YnhG family n=1 Tax=Actinokineospora diospyrosa TaxID=103728 RepID=A0ABT1I8W8_9PSEU|nr:L,D-transpeptidase family protein [Actinokineospora diospyrosa]MCP2269084.1 L,D-peptidoglycan transpeptidase YkuD, ErfK/YbiS/YcfS/YnhG family [Actinokineospora diospyrosa]